MQKEQPLLNCTFDQQQGDELLLGYDYQEHTGLGFLYSLPQCICNIQTLYYDADLAVAM